MNVKLHNETSARQCTYIGSVQAKKEGATAQALAAAADRAVYIAEAIVMA